MTSTTTIIADSCWRGLLSFIESESCRLAINGESILWTGFRLVVRLSDLLAGEIKLLDSTSAAVQKLISSLTCVESSISCLLL